MTDVPDSEKKEELHNSLDRLKQLNQQILELASTKDNLEDELDELQQACELLDGVDSEATLLEHIGAGVTVEKSRDDVESGLDERITTLEQKIERHQQSIDAFSDEFEQQRAELETQMDGLDE